MTDKQDIASLFQALAGLFPSWKPSAATFELYALALSDVPIDRLRRAAIMHARRSNYGPTVHELRDLAGDQDKIGSEEAWEEVRSQIRTVGWNGKPSFSTPEVERSVSAMGGWRTLCSTPSADMGVIQAHFMRCYAAYRGKFEHASEAVEVEKILGSSSGMLGSRQPARDDATTLDEFNARDMRDLANEELRQIERDSP